MSGSEHGGNGTGSEARTLSSPHRLAGARSASPAKRSAADMEGGGEGGGQQIQAAVPGSLPKGQHEEYMYVEQQPDGLVPVKDSMDTQDTTTQNSVATSEVGTLTANTSATSLQSDTPPRYTEMEQPQRNTTPTYSTEELDRQHAMVLEAINSSGLDMGEKGVLVSCAWLARVLSRTTEGLKSGDWKKEDREGPIGPVDNSSIVPEGGFQGPHIADPNGGDFIPLKPGMSMGTDFQVLPKTAWGAVIAAYGMVTGQHQINRYAVDTAPAGSNQQNIIYDTYPLVITIRKVLQPGRQSERPATPSTSAVENLKRKQLQRARGQNSPDDA
ncbi:hypothetical protein LTR53_018165, partial [Teratosphaeriaceae sp. CCFEE 6253]